MENDKNNNNSDKCEGTNYSECIDICPMEILVYIIYNMEIILVI
jgi:NAD-dependent dihydropyrimidine dehydrogenase PreA subunit